MHNSKSFLAFLILAALFLPVVGHAEEPYPGYGYEPTQDEHLGAKEYSPALTSLTGNKQMPMSGTPGRPSARHGWARERPETENPNRMGIPTAWPTRHTTERRKT